MEVTMRRLLSFILILCMIINIFSGCSKTKTYNEGAEGADTVSEDTEPNYIDEVEEDYDSPLASFMAE